MAIIIKGDNKGIAVDGDLRIEHLDFQFGEGVKSASGVHREVVDAEVVEEVPAVDDTKKEYPIISDVQKNFFETAFVVRGKVYGQKRTVLEMPVEWIMHTIHDLTEDWNPAETSSVHKWKLLYEVLRRLNYFRIEQKHRYADYLKAVVRYRFPEVADSYSNNISKSKLDNHFEEWSKEDVNIYNTLKEALSFK